MKRSVLAIAILLLLLNGLCFAGGRLLYAFNSQIPTNRYTQNISKKYTTDVYSIDPETGKSKLIFSDSETPFIVMYRYGSGGYPGGMIRFSSNYLYALALKRTPDNLLFVENKKDFELIRVKTDGKAQIEEVAGKIQSTIPPSSIFVSNDGSRIGYFGYDDKGTVSFVIHAVRDGKTITSVPMPTNSNMSDAQVADVLEKYYKNPADLALKRIPDDVETVLKEQNMRPLGILSSGDFLTMALSYRKGSFSPSSQFFRIAAADHSVSKIQIDQATSHLCELYSTTTADKLICEITPDREVLIKDIGSQKEEVVKIPEVRTSIEKKFYFGVVGWSE